VKILLDLISFFSGIIFDGASTEELVGLSSTGRGEKFGNQTSLKIFFFFVRGFSNEFSPSFFLSFDLFPCF
jgi:hypothetical protein